MAGAAVATAVQIVAARPVLAPRDPGAVAMLVAVARGAMVRVVGGSALVLIALAWTPARPVGFVTGFVALYVVLEAMCDIAALRSGGLPSK